MHKFSGYLGALFLLFALLGYILFDGWLGVKSVLLGQGAWLLPDLCFFPARKYIATMQHPKKMIMAFLSMEFVKLLLSVGLIILILLTCKVHTIGFFCGYIISLSSMLLLSNVVYNQHKI